MAISNPDYSISMLAQARTGRPIVLSKGFGDAYVLQCNGVHFINDPNDKQEVAAVGVVVDELCEAGYLIAEEWVNGDRRLYLTDSGREFVQRELAQREITSSDTPNQPVA